VVLVSHDRYLNEALADRIVEIEDGRCVSYEGSYADYLLARVERRAAQQRAEDVRLQMIVREAAWAARSPAARTSKSRARLQRLEALMERRPLLQRRSLQLQLGTGERLPPVLLEVDDLACSFPGRPLFEGLGFQLMRAERLGVLGPNGCGKSTLLHIIAGDLQPDQGRVRPAPRVRLALFDQARTGLHDTDTVFESAGGGNDHVKLGDRHIHVASFLGRFLFQRELLDQPVASLSGGERARLLLARLLLRGCNLLLLDEPTNDLDLQTLRVLEEALLDFDGAALVVTHDRAFLDRVCTGVLAFEPDGTVQRYASRQQLRAARSTQAQQASARSAGRSRPAPAAHPRKLSFQQRQEYQALPGRIERLEAEQAQLAATLADPATYRDASRDPGEISRQLTALCAQIEAAYARWEELEPLA